MESALNRVGGGRAQPTGGPVVRGRGVDALPAESGSAGEQPELRIRDFSGPCGGHGQRQRDEEEGIAGKAGEKDIRGRRGCCRCCYCYGAW